MNSGYMKRQVFYWEFSSSLIIIILGFLFHFAFFWFNEWRPLAVFFAVNESVWEHCKIGFWPAFFVAFVEYFYFGKGIDNFFVAKAAMLFVIPVTIITLFYTYTGVIGFNYFLVDIAIFFVAVFLGQYLSYKLLILKLLPDSYTLIAIGIIIMLAISFSTMTFNPGSIPLFVDSNTGEIGIP